MSCNKCHGWTTLFLPPFVEEQQTSQAYILSNREMLGMPGNLMFNYRPMVRFSQGNSKSHSWKDAFRSDQPSPWMELVFGSKYNFLYCLYIHVKEVIMSRSRDRWSLSRFHTLILRQVNKLGLKLQNWYWVLLLRNFNAFVNNFWNPRGF